MLDGVESTASLDLEKGDQRPMGDPEQARWPSWLPHRRPSRRVVAIGSGLAVAGLTYWLTVSGASGPLPLFLLLLLLAFTPAARALPRRLAINGGLLIGWVPVLWLVGPLQVNHGALVVASWTGALVTSLVLRRSWRTLAPDVCAADLLLLAVGALTAVVMAPWWRARSPVSALEMLLPGWDNSAHFAMFASARSYGAVLSALGPPPEGGRWLYSDYPQGFHALVATLSEVTMPAIRTGPDLLVSYTEMTSVVVGLGGLLLTSALLCLPGLRSRPALAAPAVAFTCAAYLWEPGQRLIADGFANFWFAAVAAACALLLSVSSMGHSARDSAAVAGLIVAVVQTWTPLVMFAAPAVLVIYGVRFWRLRGGLTHRRLLVLTPWILLGAVTAIIGASLLSSVSISSVVDSGGAIHGTSPLPTFVLAVAGPYVFLSYRGWLRLRDVPDGDTPTADRVARLTLVPAVGISTLALFLGAQLTRAGTTQYYFLKYLIGFELVMAAITPAVVAMLVSATTVPLRNRRRALLALSATLAASQAFGFIPGHESPLRGNDSLVPVSAPYSRCGISKSLLAASGSSAAAGGFHRAYVGIGRGGTPQLQLANAWFHALTVSSSFRELRTSQSLGSVAEPTVEDVLPAIHTALSARSRLVVLVDPQYVGPLRARLRSPDLGRRVIGW